jgi:hypothetical protein
MEKLGFELRKLNGGFNAKYIPKKTKTKLANKIR